MFYYSWVLFTVSQLFKQWYSIAMLDACPGNGSRFVGNLPYAMRNFRWSILICIALWVPELCHIEPVVGKALLFLAEGGTNTSSYSRCDSCSPQLINHGRQMICMNFLSIDWSRRAVRNSLVVLSPSIGHPVPAVRASINGTRQSQISTVWPLSLTRSTLQPRG